MSVNARNQDGGGCRALSLPRRMGSCRSKVHTLCYLPRMCGRAVLCCFMLCSNNVSKRSCQVPTTRTRTKITKAGRWRRSPNLRRSKVPLSRRFLLNPGSPSFALLPLDANVAALIWKSDTASAFNTITQAGVISTIDSRCVRVYVPGIHGSTGAEWGRDGQDGATAEAEAPPLRGAPCNFGMLS